MYYDRHLPLPPHYISNASTSITVSETHLFFSLLPTKYRLAFGIILKYLSSHLFFSSHEMEFGHAVNINIFSGLYSFEILDII